MLATIPRHEVQTGIAGTGIKPLDNPAHPITPPNSWRTKAQ
ncbi:hypothetical protein APY03_6654 [Variovorax sp. WDL1]|nr:hypothetical protein APY03_6654 [Variovorax sp. WDL1]